MDLDVANLEERQRVAMMVMDMGFRIPDEQVLTKKRFCYRSIDNRKLNR